MIDDLKITRALMGRTLEKIDAFMEYVILARFCTKRFRCSISSDLCNTPTKQALFLSPLTGKKTGSDSLSHFSVGLSTTVGGNESHMQS